MVVTQYSRYEVYTNSLQAPQQQQQEPGTRPTSSAKQDAYTEALKRSLMESQVHPPSSIGTLDVLDRISRV